MRDHQIIALQLDAERTGIPCGAGNWSRANERLVTQLITVCAHGYFLMPNGFARTSRTRETARKLMRATKNNWSAKKNQILFVLLRNCAIPRLKLQEALAGLLEFFFEKIPLLFDPGQLPVFVAKLFSPLACFVFPLISAFCKF